MRLLRSIALTGAGALVAGLLLAPLPAAADPLRRPAVMRTAEGTASDATTVSFADTHEVLHGNPYAGTAFDINSPKPAGSPGYTFSNDPAITAFIDGTERIPAEADIVRLQIAWADFEPTRNGFSWGRLDAFMQRVQEQGKTTEIQLLMSEAPDVEHDPGVFPYEYPPKWLFDDAGVQYRMAPYNGKYFSKQPIYYDPTYLTELRAAVGAFGARYDGNSGIAWVDLRAFSLFGEWSGWNDAMNFPWPDSATRTATLHSIIDVYKDAFPRSMVMMPNAGADVVTSDPDADTQEKRYRAFAFDYGAQNAGWGFRSDTVNSAFAWMNYSTTSQVTWNNRKLRRDHIQVSEGAGWDSSIMANNPRLVVKNALEGYHANLQGINNTSFADWEAMKSTYGEWFTTLGRYSGYRFVMPSATYPGSVAPGGAFTLSQVWTNNGVGFSPVNYPLRVSFVDDQGRTAWSGTDESLRQSRWFQGDEHTVQSSFTLPTGLAPGRYTIDLAMVDAAGSPRIALAMPNGQGKTYPIGAIDVRAGAAAVAAPAVQEQFKIQGEDYTAASGAYGVDAPPEGGFGSVYLAAAGQWAEYDNVDVPADGSYLMELRVSSEAGNHLAVSVDGQQALDAVALPDTGGYNTYRTVERRIELTAGRHTLRLTRPDGRWLFLNWMRFTKQSPDAIQLQAESASSQQGVSLSAQDAITDDGTPGVANIDTGDWVQYDGVTIPQSGDYLLRMRYSTTDTDPVSFRVVVDGAETTGDLQLASTGGVQDMRTDGFVVPLQAGMHSVRIVWTRAHSNVVWNWMKLDRQGSFTQTIPAVNYTMQWNLANEWSWNGPDTGVVVGDSVDNGASVKTVGSIDPQDYLRYDNVSVPYTSAYRIALRGSADSAQTVRLEIDGDPTDVRIPPTGGLFTETGAWVTLSAGLHDIRLVAETSGLVLEQLSITAGTQAVKQLNVGGASTMTAGATAASTVRAVAADGSSKPVREGVRWESSDPSVATIAADGTVTAVRWGKTLITATLDGITGGYGITVTDPTVSLVTINDDDSGLAYTGDWGYSSGRSLGDANDDVHYSTKTGDAVQYTFLGTGVAYLTEKFSDMGRVEVYIDGALAGSADAFSATRQAQQQVFRSGVLTYGTHTIRVVNLDTQAQSGKIALMDAFIIEQPRVWGPGSTVTADGGSANKITVHWTPAQTAAKITGYVIFVDGAEAKRVGSAMTALTLSGLSKGRSYKVSVQAVRPDGSVTKDGPSVVAKTLGKG